MKSFSTRGITRSRVPLIALLALAAVGMAGCSGEDGKTGATGPQGPGGGTGPTGPTGPGTTPGPSIEQGGTVIIGNGSTLSEETIRAIGGLVATIDSASITGNRPVIEFTVKTAHGGGALGLAPSVLNFMVAKLVVDPGVGLPARWQSYVNRTQTASASGPQVLPSAVQATTENGAAGTLTELDADGDGALDDGKYRYTYGVDLSNVTTPIAVAYEPSLTHRLGLEIRMSGEAEALAPDNPVADIVPDGGAGSGHKQVAATENCEKCHERFDLHGGPRRSVEYCVTCHNPGSVDPDGGEDIGMAYMAHSIHSGEGRGVDYVIYGFGGTAHDYSEVTYPQPTLFCENCHTASAASPDGDAWMAKLSASACGGCHVAGLNKAGPSAATGLYTYTYTHEESGLTVIDGDCVACHRAGGSGGDVLESHQRPVFRSGNRNPRYTVERGREFTYEILSVTDAVAGEAPTVTFRVLDGGVPVDVTSLTSAQSNLSLGIAWNTRDFHTVSDTSLPTLPLAGVRGRSVVVSLVANAAVTAGPDGSYTYEAASALPPGVDGDVMVTLYGRWSFPDGSRAAPEAAVFFTGEERQALVSQAKCENCHELLSIHGNGRSGDPMMCTACHNSSGGWSDEGFGPIALGAFVHNIHAAKGGVVEDFGGVTYPQRLANCQACHVPGSYNTARTDALPISTGPGPDQDLVASGVQNQILSDDTWDSATAGTCGTCHDSEPAKAHMTQNGGVFARMGGKTLVPSSATEACAVCHGPGRAADTVTAHAE